MGGRTFAELSVETDSPPYLKNILGACIGTFAEIDPFSSLMMCPLNAIEKNV